LRTFGLNRGGWLIRAVTFVSVFLSGALFVLAGLVHAEPEFVQSQANFEKAIRDKSTSLYLIFVTVVNDDSGEVHTECFPAPFLLGAIRKEYDLNYDAGSIEKAIQIAFANPSRVFHFSKQAAIDNVPSFTKDANVFRLRYQEACALVKEGKSVFLSDRGGQVRVDP
jgi:hypothetical protein